MSTSTTETTHFLEAQLLSNYIDVTDSLRHSRDVKLFWPYLLFFVDRFESSLQFYYLEFDREAISDGFMVHSRVFRKGC